MFARTTLQHVHARARTHTCAYAHPHTHGSHTLSHTKLQSAEITSPSIAFTGSPKRLVTTPNNQTAIPPTDWNAMRIDREHSDRPPADRCGQQQRHQLRNWMHDHYGNRLCPRQIAADREPRETHNTHTRTRGEITAATINNTDSRCGSACDRDDRFDETETCSTVASRRSPTVEARESSAVMPTGARLMVGNWVWFCVLVVSRDAGETTRVCFNSC